MIIQRLWRRKFSDWKGTKISKEINFYHRMSCVFRSSFSQEKKKKDEMIFCCFKSSKRRQKEIFEIKSRFFSGSVRQCSENWCSRRMSRRSHSWNMFYLFFLVPGAWRIAWRCSVSGCKAIRPCAYSWENLVIIFRVPGKKGPKKNRHNKNSQKQMKNAFTLWDNHHTPPENRKHLNLTQ